MLPCFLITLKNLGIWSLRLESKLKFIRRKMNGGLVKLGIVLEFFLTTTLNLRQGYPPGVTPWGYLQRTLLRTLWWTLFQQKGMLVKPMGMKKNLYIPNLSLKRRKKMIK